MKLLTMKRGGQLRSAVLLGNEVLDLVLAAQTLSMTPQPPPTLKALLALGRDGLQLVEAMLHAAEAPAAKDKLRTAKALVPADSVTFAPVIPDADLVLSAAMNSRGHLHEMGDAAPERPIAFQKLKSALTASGQSILLPPDNGDMVDWEGEFCVVIGSLCYRASVAEAGEHIVGYTMMNDVSAREFVKPYVTGTTVREVTSAWDLLVAGKNFPTFCPIGPVIATVDEFPKEFDYHLETLVNGEVMQSSTSADLVFSCAEVVSYYSHYYALVPGDIISMGSPPGVGMARKPPKFLKAGDVVEVREAHIGVLSNTVARSVQ